MRTRTLRRSTLETLSYEPLGSRDGQGKPSYGSSVSFEARARIEDDVELRIEGEDVRVALTLWVPGDESDVPQRLDRVTRDGSTYIVMTEKPVANLKNALDHTRLRCRDE